MNAAYDYWNTQLAKANPERRNQLLAKMVLHIEATRQRQAALNVANAYEWIINNAFTNENGVPMEFSDRDFMIQPLCDESKLMAVLKCSQVGFSTMSIFKAAFHNARYGHNIIYTLPTDSDVEEFNKAKTDMILDNNPTIKAQMVQNSLHTKAFRTLTGDNVGFTFFKGTYGKSASIMQTADILIKDEFDRSNQPVLNAYKSRIKASDYGAEWEFSNPTFPSFGVDFTWQLSDQKHYMYWCPACDHVAYITYEPESFDLGNTHHVCKERGEYVCGSCNNILDRRQAEKEWVSKYEEQGKQYGISGYWISQMMAPWISAKELIRDEKLMLPDVFANFDLGRPYASNSNSLDPSNIIKNVQYDENGYVPKVTPGQMRTLGVDVGGTNDKPHFHCVRGTEEGINEIIKLHGEDQLHNYMRMNNISIVVLDNAPYSAIAVRLMTAFPGKVYRCVFDYNDERKAIHEFDYKTRIVNVHRTRIFDNVVDQYITGARKVYIDGMHPTLSSMDAESLCKHWKTQRKIGGNGESPADREKNKELKLDRQGNIRPMWVNDGADHFSLGDIYNRVAQIIASRQLEGQT